jgi:predicted lipoprotein with Yx(FWY)xxD motif
MRSKLEIPSLLTAYYAKAEKIIFAGLSTMMLLLAITSCKKDSDAESYPVIEVQLKSNATFGSILTDKDGRTLYYFANDATTTNNCTGGCEAVWPVFNVNDLTAAKLGAGLTLSDFTSITTQTGKKQLTYKGRPLYYYAPLVNGVNTQEAAGSTGGENVNGVWFVAKPDYSIMFTNAQLTGHDGKNYLSNYTEGVGKTIYFTDAKGLTLYTFKNDRLNDNNFTAADFSNNGVWPIYETDKIVVPSVLDKTLFGSITVYGRKQLTYKGWPLYYFGQDAMVMGSNKGVSFPSPGVWPVPVKDITPAIP